MATYYLDYENGNNANSGADWANAWKDLTNGATAARIAPGDTVRIAKSPDPVSLGITATWTNLSRTVTLNSALTLTVDDCDSGWVAANSATVTHSTTRKEGTNSVQVTKSSYATGTLYAYKALSGSTDFSAYDAITLWVRNDAAIADANRWTVCLCSDAAGATPVDSFSIPAIPSTNQWVPLTIARTGGGSLGAAIQSVALYTGTSAPTNGQDTFLDNINACTYGGFSLQSLISKESSAAWSDEGWYGIQSIAGTTVKLDADTNTGADSGRGYSGTTETVTTYRRETIKTAMAATSSTQVQVVQDSGTVAGGNITFSGGWDTGSTTQDGVTFFDGLNGYGYGIYLASRSFVALAAVGAARYYHGVYLNSSNDNTLSSIAANNNAAYGVYLNSSNANALSSIAANNNAAYAVYLSSSNANALSSIAANNNAAYAVYLSSSNDNTLSSIAANNNAAAGFYLSSSNDNTLSSIAANNNVSYGFILSGSNAICHDLVTASNASSGVYASGGNIALVDSTLADTTETTVVAYTNSRVRSNNHDASGYDWEWTDGGTINSEATDRPSGTGWMWKLLTSSTTRTAARPLDWEIGPIALEGGLTNTIKVWMRKAHATNVNGKLVVRGGQVDGIPTDEVATLADNTDWQELMLTLSPTDDCVVMVEAWAEYVAGHAAVYVDEISEVSAA